MSRYCIFAVDKVIGYQRIPAKRFALCRNTRREKSAAGIDKYDTQVMAYGEIQDLEPIIKEYEDQGWVYLGTY